MMIEMIYKMVCKSDTIEDMLGTILQMHFKSLSVPKTCCFFHRNCFD